MTAKEIITGIFDLYTDSTSELSDAEKLSLLNRVYKFICRQRPWEFLKKSFTGTIINDEITLPTDFGMLSENYQDEESQLNRVVYVGPSRVPYKVVSFSNRNQHLGQDGYVYLDLVGNKLVFTKTPCGSNFELDYCYKPADLAANDSPVFDSDFHPMIGFGMAVDGFATQLFEKARTYAPENQGKFESYMRNLSYYNANLIID